MKNCILINSYPNNEYKQNLLREQLINFKSANLPIILCAGCTPPQDIIESVDYLIVNKKKIIKPALYQKKKFIENKPYVSAYYNYMENLVMFNDFIDLTITENIKLLFNTAKFFGFENVLYTEDDNIFINYHEYFNYNFKILNENVAKMCAVISNFVNNIEGLHTTHFFANVDFVIENFKFPHSLKELENEQSVNLWPWSTYEISILKCFENQIDKIHRIDQNKLNLAIKKDSTFGRDNDVNYIISQRICFLKNINGDVTGYIRNTSTNLNLKLKIKTNVSYDELINFNPGCWYKTPNLQLGDFMHVTIEYNGTIFEKKMIFDSEDKILSLNIVNS